MSNSYMGPRNSDQSQYGNMKEFSPDQQWAIIRQEREKALELAKLEHIKQIEESIRLLEEKKHKSDSFDLGGAL